MMETLHIRCPHCDQKYRVTSQQLQQKSGQMVTCTKCRKAFAFAAPTKVESASQAPNPAAPKLPSVPAHTLPAPPRAEPSAPPPKLPSVPPPAVPASALATPVLPPARLAPPPAVPAQAHAPGPAATPVAPPTHQSNGMALVSLICGIAMCVPVISSVLAIVFGILGLRIARQRSGTGHAMSLAGLILGVVGLVLIPLAVLVAWPMLSQGRELANRAVCMANMVRINQAMVDYVHGHGKQMPADLWTLAASQKLPPKILICPSCIGTGASYIYVHPRGPIRPNTVVLYEPLSNHQNQGMNVLYGNGSVKWLGANEARSLLATLRRARTGQ